MFIIIVFITFFIWIIVGSYIYSKRKELAKKYEVPLEQIWFAWYPVRSGALGSGPIIWMEFCWRDSSHLIYQDLDVLH